METLNSTYLLYNKGESELSYSSEGLYADRKVAPTVVWTLLAHERQGVVFVLPQKTKTCVFLVYVVPFWVENLTY